MFKSGDKVLVLLPIPGQPLRAKYFGLFEVDRKVNDLNYIVKKHQVDARANNSIKQYHNRTDIVPPKEESVAAANTEVMTLEQVKFSFEYDQSAP